MKKILFALLFISNSRQRLGFRLLIFACCAQFSFAQNALVKQWDYRFGGPEADFLYSFQQTADAGYILGGFSASGIGGDKTQPMWGATDYWIVKIDSLGIKQWDKRFGGTYNEYLFSIQQTADEGYILGGFSNSSISGDKTQDAWNYSLDYWIVKTDSDGNFQWDKRFGGDGEERLFSVQQTNDKGYFLAGESESEISGDKTQSSQGSVDYWVVKTDSLGNYQWDKRLGGNDYDWLTSAQQTSDRGYILGGYTWSGISGDKTQSIQGIGPDYWIVKIDSLGNYQWDKSFGGDLDDYLFSVQQTKDNGYILGGVSYSGISGDKTQPSKGGYDYWIIKTDSIGDKEWDKDLGGDQDEESQCIVSQVKNGSFLLAGSSFSNASGDKSEDNWGPEQTWIVKIDSNGNKLWDKTVLLKANSTDDYEVSCAVETKDGCYAIITVKRRKLYIKCKLSLFANSPGQQVIWEITSP